MRYRYDGERVGGRGVLGVLMLGNDMRCSVFIAFHLLSGVMINHVMVHKININLARIGLDLPAH